MLRLHGISSQYYAIRPFICFQHSRILFLFIPHTERYLFLINDLLSVEIMWWSLWEEDWPIISIYLFIVYQTYIQSRAIKLSGCSSTQMSQLPSKCNTNTSAARYFPINKLRSNAVALLAVLRLIAHHVCIQWMKYGLFVVLYSSIFIWVDESITRLHKTLNSNLIDSCNKQ